MARPVKKKTNVSKKFVPMERTRALLSELWGHWRQNLEHTPDTAKRMLTSAIKELHKDEVDALKQVKKKQKDLKKSAKVAKKATKEKVKKKVTKTAKAINRKVDKV